MADSFDLNTTKDMFDLGNRATNEKISGVDTRLRALEEAHKEVRKDVSELSAKLEGINARLAGIEKTVDSINKNLLRLQDSVSEIKGYKSGLTDGFKAVRWIIGVVFTVIGGAVTLACQYLFKL